MTGKGAITVRFGSSAQKLWKAWCRRILLLAVCILPGTCNPAMAQEVHGYVTYNSFIADNLRAPFYYRDSYFLGRSVDYSDSLSTMSMCLALSTSTANNGEDYSHGYANLYALLEQCGFDMDSFAADEAYSRKPGMDTIGIGAAGKRIIDENGEPCWLIACGIRGISYEAEWAGNLTMGRENEHEGFNEAAAQVISFLREYAENHPQFSGKVKLWITGYSRGAAVANLTAGMLDEGIHISDRFSLGTDNVYAYCFESPQATLIRLDAQDVRYRNIFVIVNQSDAVPKLAPTMPYEAFGFTHYGVVFNLPSLGDSEDASYRQAEERMLQYYNQLEGTEEYPPGQFRMKKLSVHNILKGEILADEQDGAWTQPFFLDSMLESLSAMIGSREVYTREYQDEIRELIRLIFSAPQAEDVVKSFAGRIRENAARLAMYTAASVVYDSDRLTDLLEEELVDSLEECGVKAYSKENVRRIVETLSKLLMRFGESHPNYLATLASNLKEIATSHFPELCLAWLMSFDENYGEGNHPAFVYDCRRVLHITSSAGMTVCNADGEEIGSLMTGTSGKGSKTHSAGGKNSKGETQKDRNLFLAVIDEDGDMFLDLPMDEDCTIVLHPNENGSGKIELEELSGQFGLVRLIQYNEPAIKKGESYTFSASAIALSQLEKSYELTEGTDAVYQLADHAGSIRVPEMDERGTEIRPEEFRVRALADDTGYGWTEGGGVGYVGDYEQVMAYPIEGCRFTGWYEGDRLVSREPVYRFMASRDITLEARFAKDQKDSRTEAEGADSRETGAEEKNASA